MQSTMKGAAGRALGWNQKTGRLEPVLVDVEFVFPPTNLWERLQDVLDRQLTRAKRMIGFPPST